MQNNFKLPHIFGGSIVAIAAVVGFNVPANALDFNFSSNDFTGTLSFNDPVPSDGTTTFSPSTNLSTTLTLFNGSTVSATYNGTNGSSGAPSFTYDGTDLNVASSNFNTFLVFDDDSSSGTYNLNFADSSGIDVVGIGGVPSFSGNYQPVSFTAQSTGGGGATPVPFGVDPTSGLFLLGGIWGASQLKKKWKNRNIADDLNV